MAIRLKDILNVIDEMAPFSLSEEWDNSGLQVGTLSHEVNRILVALDPTLGALEFASSTGADLLLTHHPLIFTPLSSIDTGLYPGNIINMALNKGISIVAAHTNLDAAKGGISDILADLIGLLNIEVLDNGITSAESGMGRIGDLSESKGMPELVDIIKKALSISELRIVGSMDKRIKRVAVMGGSGGGFALTAFNKGADLFVTGDIKHHEALDAETIGLAMIDAGHFQTERAAFLIFAKGLEKKITALDRDVLIEKYVNEKNPIRFG